MYNRGIMSRDGISIINSSGSSFEHMRRVLFGPFSVEKWFLLGFSAWLTDLGSGWRSNFSGNFSLPSFNSLTSGTSSTGAETGADSLPMDELAAIWDQFGSWITGFGVLLAIAIALVAIAVAIALSWVNARGKFMFLDNLVYDRALVTQPWKEFKRQGNSLFLWQLGFLLVLLLVFALLAGAVIAMALGLQEAQGAMIAVIVVGSLIGVGLMTMAAYIQWLLNSFVVPIMHRERILVRAAWARFLPLHRAEFGLFCLFALWTLLLSFAAGAVIMMVGLGTCCLGALLFSIPYLGSVILLPVSSFFRFLGPHFLRQFGRDWDLFQPGDGPPSVAGGALVQE